MKKYAPMKNSKQQQSPLLVAHSEKQQGIKAAKKAAKLLKRSRQAAKAHKINIELG